MAVPVAARPVTLIVSRQYARGDHAFFAVVLVDAASAADERPIGNNCELTAPPQSAGEEMHHGIGLRIFPRALRVVRTYSYAKTTARIRNDIEAFGDAGGSVAIPAPRMSS